MGILHAGRVQSGHLDHFRCRRGEYRRRRLGRGTLIHHAGGLATPVVQITVPVIGTAFRALLVATPSGPDVQGTRLVAAVRAAVALASVASAAKKEQGFAANAYHETKRLHVTPPVRVRLRWTCSSFREKTDATECRSTRHSGGPGA